MRGLKLTDTTHLRSCHELASKHQNPREGIKTSMTRSVASCSVAMPSKHQNPREGIKTQAYRCTARYCDFRTSKHQNPREGIKTQWSLALLAPPLALQNTKIPVRGLKRRCVHASFPFVFSSKHQNPREGIKTSA